MHDSTADPWYLHNVRAFLRMCAGEMEEAEKEFGNALRLDRRATINRGWYAFFVFVTGRPEEALRLFGVLADEHAADADTQALYGIYLCRAKRLEDAERALK
jgi:Tfp pilus assembly protein PilF